MELHHFTSDPVHTKDRVERLTRYWRSQVVNSRGKFICGSCNKCKRSLRDRTKESFFEGYLPPHVGSHYDLFIDGKPFRMLLLPMSWGAEPYFQTFAQRRDGLIRAGAQTRARGGAPVKGCPARNPHMSGTTYAFRLILGLGLRELSPASEFITIEGQQVHLYDSFAWINFLQCSALLKNRSKDVSTTVMRSNCSRHVRNVLDILEPNLIVGQGVSKWLASNGFSANDGLLEEIAVADGKCLLLNFCHPSVRDENAWGNSPKNKYLLT